MPDDPRSVAPGGRRGPRTGLDGGPRGRGALVRRWGTCDYHRTGVRNDLRHPRAARRSICRAVVALDETVDLGGERLWTALGYRG